MSEVQQRNPDSCNYFDEDIVYRINSKGQIEVGVVVESCENASSSDDDTDDDGLEEVKKKYKRLKIGTTGVCWFPKGNTETLPENKVKLYDRSLLPGDVVKCIDPARSGLIGCCKSTIINFSLKIIGTNKVIENVSSSDFETLNPIQADIVCVYDSWIGYIDDTCYAVTLLCKDGSIVILQDEDLNDFVDVLDENYRSFQFVTDHHYIGQRLTGPAKALKKGNWIKQSPEMVAALASKKLRKRRVQVSVINVELASISCRWLCYIHGNNTPATNGSEIMNVKLMPPKVVKDETTEDSDSSLKENQRDGVLNLQFTIVKKKSSNTSLRSKTEKPCDIIYGEEVKNVKVLNYFQKCTLQVGDLGYYTLKETDKLCNEDIFVKRLTKRILRERFDLSKNPQGSDKLIIKEAKNDKNSPDKLKPNGGCEEASKKTSKVNSSNDDKSDMVSSEDEYEEISESDDCSDSATDLLYRFLLNEFNTTKSKANHKKKYPSVSVKKIKAKKLRCSKKRESCEVPSDLTPGRRFAVQIISTETKVDVVWQNNEETSNIPSYLLYPMHHLDGHEFFPGDFVIENKESVSLLDYGVVQKVDRSARTVLVKWFLTRTSDSQPVFISKQNVSAYDIKDHPDHHYRAGCCVLRVDSTKVSANSSTNPESRAGQVIECCTDGQLLCAWADGTKSKVYPHELFIIGEYDADDLWGSDVEIEEVDNSNLDNSIRSSEQGTPNCKVIERKGEFAMIESVPSAHSYKASALNPNEHFNRKLRKEIVLLKSSLPPDIHVKSFEERADLFSVMIKGPSDTPYEDGLFLFDIQLPSKYPFAPPAVHYKSYCTDRLNPNLYESGKVCISLLGTWTGKGTEVWDPKSSTLLQLLLSIQGLILVPEPYYNEAGYMRQKGTDIGHENSRLYNEMVIVKLIQSMSKLISCPDDAFREEIIDHFSKRMKYFVRRIETWLKISEHWNAKYSPEQLDQMGTLISQDGFDTKCIPGFPLLPGSQGFCLSAFNALRALKENLTSKEIKF